MPDAAALYTYTTPATIFVQQTPGLGCTSRRASGSGQEQTESEAQRWDVEDVGASACISCAL